MLKFHLVCYPETFMVGRAAQEKICILEKVAYMRSPGLKGSTSHNSRRRGQDSSQDYEIPRKARSHLLPR